MSACYRRHRQYRHTHSRTHGTGRGPQEDWVGEPPSFIHGVRGRLGGRMGLYRDPSYGRLAGVCYGVARYFGISPWWVRAGWIVGLIMNFPLAVMLYLAGWILMPRADLMTDATGQRGWNQRRDTNTAWETYDQNRQAASSHSRTDDAYATSYTPDTSHSSNRTGQGREPNTEATDPNGSPNGFSGRPDAAFDELRRKFKDLETRAGSMERRVTSSNFDLDRQIRGLT